jgi:hypothetical protein
MLVTGIKSKPVYAPLRADFSGRTHLMLGRNAGLQPLLRVLAELRAEDPAALTRTRVLFASGGASGGATGDLATDVAPKAPPDAPPPAGADAPPDVPPDARADAAFHAAGVADVRTYRDARALLADTRRLFETATMGLRLYVAGPESFIGLAMQLALEFNLNQDEIRAEECGTRARRVRCVHCRETTEDVRTNIVRCVGCARWLLVRDHYSRRLAAYMGVMVDAESPGELPPIQEAFP